MRDTAQQFMQTNSALKIAGYILTNHNGRSKLAKALEESIEKAAQENGVRFLGIVRQGIAIREAQALCVSLYEYAPNSNPAGDYLKIFDKLHKGGGDHAKDHLHPQDNGRFQGPMVLRGKAWRKSRSTIKTGNSA